MAIIRSLILRDQDLKRSALLFFSIIVLALFVPSIFVGEALDTSGESSSGLTSAVTQVAEMNITGYDVLVLVNSTIYEGVKTSLEQYRKDLEDFGFEDVIILNWAGTTPEDIRLVLQQFYLNSTLAGALLVGDLPAVEYEMFTVWDYERFPIDLYYMDLDGDWGDSDGDGVLDLHFGKKIAPDIWVGRIKTSGLGEDEVSLVNKYFEKNHHYRNGSLTVPNRALLYIDDDWENLASMDNESLELLYDNLTVVSDKATTTATDYKNRLGEGYQWVHVRSHGTWLRHSFEIPGGDGGVISSSEYADIDPDTLFYQLFICHAARFTEPGYLAGEVIFKTSKGLASIGSTKLGGMQMFWTFYDALARGRTIGDAFKEWFVKWGEGKVTILDSYVGRKWFYGLTIVGDPTLRLRWLGEQELADLEKREAQAIADSSYVQDLLEQINATETSYSTLNSEYNNLRSSHSLLQETLTGVIIQLTDIRNLFYFFFLATIALLISNAYYANHKPKSKTSDYE
jgi:hypothetical protein